jgi:hypothetical protein
MFRIDEAYLGQLAVMGKNSLLIANALSAADDNQSVAL